ncbi:hypothetical protein ACEE94_11885 [Staphylococcus epidermidis]
MLQNNMSFNNELNAKDFVDIIIELKDFFEQEYDSDETVSEIIKGIDDDLRIPIAFTDLYGNEYFEIQTYLDLKLLSIVKEVSGHYENSTLVHYEFEKLVDKEQVIEYIRNTEFGEMTSIRTDINELLQILKDYN